jgi:hypothetical protein
MDFILRPPCEHENPQSPGGRDCAAVGADRNPYFGASRIAPSSRITSPFNISFSMMCCASRA